jgi:hypothetical protein
MVGSTVRPKTVILHDGTIVPIKQWDDERHTVDVTNGGQVWTLYCDKVTFGD